MKLVAGARRSSARGELARILRPGGRAALFWNARWSDANPFLRACEEQLLRFGTDYRQVDHTRLGAAAFAPFVTGSYESWMFHAGRA